MRTKSLRAIAFFAAASACTPAISTTTGPSPAGSGSSSTDIFVLSTTDVHGRIRSWDYYTDSAESIRGLTRAATIVDSIRAAHPGQVLLVDAGDLLQGNPFAYIAMKQFGDSVNPIISAMNAMHYDAAAIGNHEYNYGVPYLEKAVKDARFPMLSANTFKPDGTHKFRAWTIVERRGIKIGIVGATTPGVMVWDAENVRGKVTVSDIVPAVRKAVQEVRAAGASVVIVSVHSGLNEPSSYDTVATKLPSENVSARMAREIPGIDLIVYGHSHKEQPDLHIGSTLLVQPKNWATSVGVARLSLVRNAGNWKVASSKGETVQSRGHAEAASVVAVSETVHRAAQRYANNVIGTTSVAWRGDSARLKDSPLIDLINEVELKATGADLASTAAFTLDAALDAGPVTVAEMARLYPYDNTLRAVRISGKQLRDYLEFSARFYKSIANGNPVPDPQIPGYNFDIVSGANYELDLSRPIGSRVTSLAVKGKPVTDSDSFTLALNNYRQTGGGGFAMLQGAPVVYDKQQEIRQLLIDEVQARKTIKPEDFFKQNWRLVYPGGGGVGSHAQPLAPGTPRLRIIGTNDFHGALQPRTDANGGLSGGAAYTASVIEKARSECSEKCTSLLLDGGDLFQGTLLSNATYGRPVVEYYNRMGYTAAAVGNHELDWGVDTLRARMKDARFAFLAANVTSANGRDALWIRNDTIVVSGKSRVGIIGILTTVTATSVLAARLGGLRFLDPAPVIDKHARELRARGADVIVVIAHEGGFCDADGGSASCKGNIFEIASRLTEKVDLILSGHTHSLVNTSVNGIPIVQARSGGQAVEVVDIPLTEDGKIAGQAVGEVRPVNVASVTPYSPVDSIVGRATARLNSLINRRITRIDGPLEREGNQYALGNIVVDAHRWAGKGDIAITNNRGIRASLRSNNVTYGALFEVQPFGNTLYKLRMTGAQVREYFEKLLGGNEIPVHISGITIGYNPEKPKGARIVSLNLPAGRTLSDNAVYDVIANNFVATGGSNMGPPDGVEAIPLDIVDLDALVDYLKAQRSPIKAPTEHRIFIEQ